MLIYYYYTHNIIFHSTIKNPPAVSISSAWLHILRNLYNVTQTIITCLSCKYEEAFAQNTATVGTRLLYCTRHPLSCLGVYARWPFAGKGSENRYIRFVPTAWRTVTVRLFRTKRYVETQWTIPQSVPRAVVIVTLLSAFVRAAKTSLTSPSTCPFLKCVLFFMIFRRTHLFAYSYHDDVDVHVLFSFRGRIF